MPLNDVPTPQTVCMSFQRLLASIMRVIFKAQRGAATDSIVDSGCPEAVGSSTSHLVFLENLAEASGRTYHEVQGTCDWLHNFVYEPVAKASK